MGVCFFGFVAVYLIWIREGFFHFQVVVVAVNLNCSTYGPPLMVSWERFKKAAFTLEYLQKSGFKLKITPLPTNPNSAEASDISLSKFNVNVNPSSAQRDREEPTP